ncbi:hypothetical protein EV121DRAFT_160192, partial [Schizophyllum commune]
PKSFKAALARPDSDVWMAAMQKEKASLDAKGVFKPCDLPKGHRALPVQWVYAWKASPDGTNPCHMAKARLV